MKKIYELLFGGLMLAIPVISNGQILNPNPNNPRQQATFIAEGSLNKIPGPVTPYAAGCDTLLFTPDVEATYGATFYTLGPGNGYLTGTNVINDKQKGNFFDVNPIANSNYVTGVRFALAKVNGADLTKEVFFRVYNLETSGITLAGSSDGIPLSDLKPLVGGYVDLQFPGAIPLASKIFIISMDYSNLSWAAGDSLSIFSSAINSVMVPDSAVEQKSNDSWGFMSNIWNGLNNGMFVYLFPYVSSNTDCALAIKLTSFSASGKGTQNKLSWTTQTEIDNAGFEAQRSADGINFNKIDFVSSKAYNGNSDRPISYSYIDQHPLPQNNYYRLKQVDHTGNKTYSSVVLVNRSRSNNNGIFSFYPIPVKNILNVQLSTSRGYNTTLTIINLAGITVIQRNITLTGTSQKVALDVSALPKGTYFVKIMGEKGYEKFVKD